MPEARRTLVALAVALPLVLPASVAQGGTVGALLPASATSTPEHGFAGKSRTYRLDVSSALPLGSVRVQLPAGWTPVGPPTATGWTTSADGSAFCVSREPAQLLAAGAASTSVQLTSVANVPDPAGEKPAKATWTTTTYLLDRCTGGPSGSALTDVVVYPSGPSTDLAVCDQDVNDPTCRVQVAAGKTASRIVAPTGSPDVLWARTGKAGLPVSCQRLGDTVQFDTRREKTAYLLYDGDGSGIGDIGTAIDAMLAEPENAGPLKLPVCFAGDDAPVVRDASGTAVAVAGYHLPRCSPTAPAPCVSAERFRSASGRHDVLSVVELPAHDPKLAH